MSTEYTVLGDFKGRFKTNQSVTLGLTETFPKDLEHKVQVYQGAIINSLFEERYSPEKYRKLSSFLLLNVPNVSVQGNKEAPFSDKRVYTFSQLIIIDPKITRTYDMKGQTYGELEGKIYGVTAKNPQINQLDPPPIDADNGGNSGGIGSTDFNEESDIGQAFNRAQTGCGNALNGCWTNFWRILYWILLLLFLWWLMRSCDRMAADDGVCDRRDEHKRLLEEEKKERDSLKHIYDQNVVKALANIKNIYFYQNSSEIHEYSSMDKGNLNRLTRLLQVCNDKSFDLFGHHSGKEIESTTIDLSRAEVLRNYFIENGINASHLRTIGMGDKEALDAKKLYDFMAPNYEIKYYNRNMRVEVKLQKNE